MLRILTKRLPHKVLKKLPEEARRFSWIAANRYQFKDLNAGNIKAKAHQNIVQRVGPKAQSIPAENIDFMIDLVYEQLKGQESQKVQDELVGKISDPNFSFNEYVAERFSVPSHLLSKAEADAIAQKHAQEDYEPDIEDAETFISLKKPPKGVNFKHFTELLPENVRAPKNVLEVMPENALCVTSLPDSVGPEIYEKLFSKFGKILQCTLLKDVNHRPMYTLITYKDKSSISEAKKVMNNYFIEGCLLKVKDKENIEEEMGHLRTLYVSNIPQSVRPEDVQKYLGGYGRIVQIELPLVDSLQYSKINQALAKSDSITNPPGESTATLDSAIKLSYTRKQVAGLKQTIFDELRKNPKKPTPVLLEAVAKMAELINNSDLAMIKSRKEGEAAVSVLSSIEEVIGQDIIDAKIKERIEKCISNYLTLKDEEVALCIQNIPSFNQLIGKQPLSHKDDIDIGEREAKKPDWKKDSDDLLRYLNISTKVDEYIDNHKETLTELYEIMTEKEVRELLKAGVKYSPVAISVDEVAEKLVQNLRTWKQKNVALSNEEAYKKEKALIKMLVNAKKKFEAFSAKYKNYYEALYEEINSVDPKALMPNSEIEFFADLKALVRKNDWTNPFFKVDMAGGISPLLTVEDIDKAEREYRRSKVRHKGYCMVTFSTTDEAKRFMIEIVCRSVIMDNQVLNATLKNYLDHRHLDLEYLVARTKQEAAMMEVKSQADIAEKLVEYYEKNMYRELPGYHNLLKFRDAAVSLFDPDQKNREIKAIAEGNREDILKKLKSIEKMYPNVDFSPLFITEEMINSRISEHKEAFLAYKEEQLKKAGIPTKTQKERVDEIIKKDPAVVAAQSFIDEKITKFDFIKEHRTEEEKVGRFSPSKFAPGKFVQEYLSRDRETSPKNYLEGKPKDENPALLTENAANVDPSVKAYAEYIKSLSKGKTEETTLESYMQQNKPKAIEPIPEPTIKEKTEPEANPYDRFYKFMGRVTLNKLTPNEYFDYFNYLLAKDMTGKTITGEEYLKPSDHQKIVEDNDLACRYLTGGTPITNLIATMHESQNEEPEYVKFLRNQELNSDEEEELKRNANEMLDPAKANPLMKLVMLKEKMEREYYFDPTQGESLEAHLTRITSVPGIDVSYNKLENGLYLIKKKLRLPFKYELAELSKISPESIRETMYQRFDKLLEGLTPEKINELLKAFGINVKERFSDTIKEIALDNQTKEQIWDVLSKKANGDVDFGSFEAELKEVARNRKELKDKAYIDASFLSQQITSIVQDEIKATKMDEARFHKEIAMQIEMERLEKLYKKEELNKQQVEEEEEELEVVENQAGKRKKHHKTATKGKK